VLSRRPGRQHNSKAEEDEAVRGRVAAAERRTAVMGADAKEEEFDVPPAAAQHTTRTSVREVFAAVTRPMQCADAVKTTITESGIPPPNCHNKPPLKRR